MEENADENVPLMGRSISRRSTRQGDSDDDDDDNLNKIYDEDAEVMEVQQKEEAIDEVNEEEEIIDDDNDELKADLFKWVKKGVLHKVERLIDNGVSVNITCTDSLISLLHYAAFLGDAEILEALLDKGADPRAEDRKERTPLDMAVWMAHDKCVEIILEKTQNENVEHEKFRESYVSDSVIEEIAELDEVWDESTPLHLASARIHNNVIKLLLNHGYRAKLLDRNGLSPLDVCGHALKPDELKEIKKFRLYFAIKLLMNEEDSTRSTPITQSSPLHKAILIDAKESMKMLMNMKSFRFAFDENGLTPLHLAVQLKKKHLMNILLFDKKKLVENFVDCKDRNGNTPLHLAIRNKWRKGMSILLKAGASVLETGGNGNTAIHYASDYGTPFILQDVIAALGKDRSQLDAKNAFDEAPLFLAIQGGNENMVKILLDEGASLDVTLSQGYNPVHMAVLSMKPKILRQILMADGINGGKIINKPCLDSQYGMSPLHLAANENNIEAFRVLMEFGADIKRRTTINSFTPLHIAAVKGNIKLIDAIINLDPTTLNERDNINWKPFYRAVHKGHKECVSLFLKRGADLSERLIHRGKTKSVIQLLITNMPRSVNYLERIFDEAITKNECEIDDECCEISIDYSILMPADDSEFYDNQMGVVVALLDTGRRLKQRRLLLHPFIESFLYLKWMNGLRFFYALLVVLYSMFLISLTTVVIRTYAYGLTDDWSRIILAVFTAYIYLQEACLVLILLSRGKAKVYFKRKMGIMNWTIASLSVAVLCMDHFAADRNWPKAVTGSAILLAWVELTVLLSNFPECGYTFQMFSTVTLRALKVMALFGVQMIIGFSIAFWVMFHNQTTFTGVFDSFARTVVMTTEFDYVSLIEDLEPNGYRFLVQIVFILFVFFVPIVMMNLILALIISDTNDLKRKGNIKRLASQVLMIDVLDTVIYFLSRRKMSHLDRMMKIYPGKPSWEAISLVSNNLEEELFKRVANKKPDENAEANQEFAMY